MSYPNRRRTWAALVLLGLLVCGCARTETVDRTGEASQIAEQYLAGVAGASEDRGWSLLHPDGRDVFGGSIERYINAVLASDWTSFEWAIEDVVPDDPSLFMVRVRTDPPAFLVQLADGQRVLQSNGNGTANLWIRFSPMGSGVWPN